MLNISRKPPASDVGTVIDATEYLSTVIAEAVCFSIFVSYSMVSSRNLFSAFFWRSPSLPERFLLVGSGGSKTGTGPGPSMLEGNDFG